MGKDRAHRVLNVYGEEATAVVDDAVEMAMEDGAENKAEAMEMMARAYVGLW